MLLQIAPFLLLCPRRPGATTVSTRPPRRHSASNGQSSIRVRLGLRAFSPCLINDLFGLGGAPRLLPITLQKLGYSLLGNSGPRLLMTNLKSDEVLGNHRRQSQQSRMELGLRISRGFQGANDLDC